MNIKNKLILATPLLLTALILSGCSSDSKKVVDLNLQYMTTNSAPVNSIDSSDQAQIAEAATSVGQSLQQLSAIQIATHPGVRMTAPSSPQGLAARASLDWNGPIKPLLAKIADASHFRLQVLGSAPAIPVMVNITSNNQTLGSILRNVQYQAAGRATINVYTSSQTIELRYANN